MLPMYIETNAFWCTDDDLVRERLIEIKELGLIELMVSCDVFHQEFVPLERVERAARIGREIIGEKGVRVRFQEFLDNPIDVMKLTEEEKMDAFRDELRQRPERMAGRAATSLSHFVDKHPKETFANVKCLNPILKSRHIHIDPYGNVFPSVCSGLILSNAKKQRLSEIYETLDYNDRPVMKLLVENGPVPLLEEAIEHGFEDSNEGYASECHLCFVARMFLWEQGLYPDEIGPEEIYTD